MSQDLLFYSQDLRAYLASCREGAKNVVMQIPPNSLLNRTDADITEEIVEQFHFRTPVIDVDSIYNSNTSELQFKDRRPATSVQIAVPFSGNPGFFQLRPEHWTVEPPRAIVYRSELLLNYTVDNHDVEKIKQEYMRTVDTIAQYLAWMEESARQFNNELEPLVRSLVVARREHLLKDAGMAAALGLPMKKREGIPTTYSIPINRKSVKISRPPTKSPFQQEPALDMDIYEDVINILTNMATVMEYSPNAFRHMGEEDLRWHFLVMLNANYEGQATGETFNYQGKTDILIRHDGKNVFVAECKFWQGEKGLLDTITQLLSYLSWRDTKAAVLIFNRNKNLSAVIEKVSMTVPKHLQYKRSSEAKSETSFRYVFRQPGDPDRETILTVLVFDIPLKTPPHG